MKKAIGFAINDNYAFALGTVLINMSEVSEKIFAESDIIVYHDNLSDNNIKLLSKIKNNIKFKSIDDTNFIPNKIYEHHDAKGRWGKFIFQKFNCFDLIKEYDEVLFLDTDILILNKLDDFFSNDCDIAWGTSYRKPSDLFKNAEKIKNIFPPNGGVVYFNKSLLKYAITSEKLNKIADEVDGIASLDEQMLAKLAYSHGMNIKCLPPKFNERDLSKKTDTIILHFIGRYYPVTPWTSQYSFLSNPEWGYYYKKWLKLGGTGPIKVNNDDLYNPNKIFSKLFYTFSFLDILRNLDIIKNQNLYTDFIYNNNYCIFYIKNFPKQIHYELLLIGENIFYSCLHLENSDFFTKKNKNIIDEIYNDLNSIFNSINYYHTSSKIAIEIKSSRDNINFTINRLFNLSFNKLCNIFN